MLIRRIPSFTNRTTALRELDDARREMERLFDSLTESSGLRTAGVFPPINVTDTGETVRVRAELPGIKPDELDLSVENDTLTIAGERKMPDESEQVSYHRREREWGSFRRSFDIPTRVAPDQVQARYSGGILTVDLPKAPEARPKQITVDAGA